MGLSRKVKQTLLEKFQKYNERFFKSEVEKETKEIEGEKIIHLEQIHWEDIQDDGLIIAKYEVPVGKNIFPYIGEVGYFIRAEDNKPQKIFIRKIIRLEWRMSRNEDRGMVLEVVCKAEIAKEPSPKDYKKPFTIINGGKTGSLSINA